MKSFILKVIDRFKSHEMKKTIMITAVICLNCIYITSSAIAQQKIVVKGKVADDKGEPLIGVSVTVKGISLGTSTNAKGEYSIKTTENAILQFSFVGFIKQEVPVTGPGDITITLLPESNSLDEIVVTAFGISREKKTLSYSTQSVDTKQLTEARELNVINSLSGKVAGISITPSGAGVGSSSRVVLRGNRSISGDSQPLYVVDGVPVLGDPQDFNPDDIASVDVLKGPNAAALYGSDAQNGAIVMTTKKGGSPGEVKVSFNNTFMLQQANLNLDLQNEYAQGSQGIYQPSAANSWGPKMDGQMVDTWSLNPADAGKTYALLPQPDNVRDLFRTGYTLSDNLQVRLGGDKTQTYLSATNTRANGILPNNSMAKKDLLASISGNINDKISVNAKIAYSYQSTDNPTRTSDNNYNPMQQIYNIPRNIRSEDVKQYEFLGSDGINEQNFWAPGVASTSENPYWVLNRNLSENNRQRINGMLSVQYKISNDFSAMLRGGYDKIDDDFDQKDYNGTYIRAEKGRYTKTISSRQLYNVDFLLSYNKKLSSDWDIDLHAGANRKGLSDHSLSSNTGDALLIPNFFSLSNTNTPLTSYDPGSPTNVQSVYAFGKVGWKNDFFLDLTARNDWSSTLPEGHRSYFYPSVGLSSVLTDLIPTLPNVISFAKARISWAKVGNSPQPFMLQRSATFTSGGNNGFLALDNILPNTTLKPEVTNSLEGGIDIRFFHDRIGIDATYFKTNTKNQLFTIELPVGSGASSFYTNGGDVQNTGVEIMLTSRPVQSRDFTWNFNVNFSKINNIVKTISDDRPKVKVGGDTYMRDYVVEQGHPFGEMYSRGLVRDDEGRVIVGSNGLPKITSDKSFNMGSFNPDFTGGISSSFDYKSFSLSFVIDHRQGGKVASFTNASLASKGLSSVTLQGRDGGLIFGNNFFGNEKAVLEDGSPNNIAINAENFWYSMGNTSAVVGELFTEDATNTRLRELTIGYNFPKTLAKKLHFANVKFSLVGRNLFFLYRKDPTLDPEILTGTTTSSEGFSSYAPPSTRTFGANLKIDF